MKKTPIYDLMTYMYYKLAFMRTYKATKGPAEIESLNKEVLQKDFT